MYTNAFFVHFEEFLVSRMEQKRPPANKNTTQLVQTDERNDFLRATRKHFGLWSNNSTLFSSEKLVLYFIFSISDGKQLIWFLSFTSSWLDVPLKGGSSNALSETIKLVFFCVFAVATKHGLLSEITFRSWWGSSLFSFWCLYGICSQNQKFQIMFLWSN